MTDALVSHDRSIRIAPPRPQAVSSRTGLSLDKILVPLDGSALAERSLPYLLAITRALEPQVTLLHVLEPPHGLAQVRGVDTVEWEMLRAERQAYLAAIAARLEQHGLQCRVELAQGNPADQIARFAKRQAVDLIVLTSHGDGGPSANWMLGGTAQKVVGTATTSLFIVPANSSTGTSDDEVQLHRMLLPLDCSRRAECILPAASDLARSHDAELVLVHIVPEPEMPRRMGPSREDVELAQKLVESNRREAAGYLREIQNRLSAEAGRVQVRLRVAANRAQTLQELAERESIDLVVLAAHGSTGDIHQRYGGVAGQFLQNGSGPVMILQDLAGRAAAEETSSELAPPGRQAR
jgi:nucleotide-binding universal stress UspA family protein